MADGSQELLVRFEVQQPSEELYGHAEIQQLASVELYARFEVNYWYHASHLVINTGSIVGNMDDTRAEDGNRLELNEVAGPTGFDYEFHFENVPDNLEFGVRLNGYYDGNAAHTIKVYEWNFNTVGWDAVTPNAKDIEDGVADQDYVWMCGGPNYISSGEYRFQILHSSAGNVNHDLFIDYLWLDETYSESIDLYASFEAQVSLNLYAHAIIRNIGSAELYAHAIIRQSASVEVYGHGIIRNIGSAEPYAHFIVRQTRALELLARLWIRQPYRLWTNRRYINGVIQLDEKLLGSAILEYVIEGVMQDITCQLIDNDLDYDWDNILETPKLIRRATTYGVVAALYARKARTFTSRVIPVVAPVTVTVIGDDERAMNHWVDKMNNALELYISAQGGLVMQSSTADEEPIFSMADIPPSLTEYTPWYEWLMSRGRSQ